jgi:hypothetical protein
MIASVVLCPHPPLLFRELGGIADPVADLRTACLEALRSALSADPSVMVVVAAIEADAVVDGSLGPDVRRFGGLGAASRPGLPLPLGVGRRLLDDVGWAGPTELVGIDLDAGTASLEALATELASRPDRLVVLLLGDGSARRDQKGPGTLDERASPFDATVVEAVRNGDVEALAGLDVDLAEELLVLGRAAFRLLGEIGRQLPPAATQVLHEDDPFGVLYLVAAWTWRDS